LERDVICGNVVIGGGQAGARAIHAMREAGYQGRIDLIARETRHPYERPPLSKENLEGCSDLEIKYVLEPSFYYEHGVHVHLDVEACSIDAAARAITLSDGRSVGYERLLLATGCRPRRLDIEGADLARVLYLRTFEDSAAIAACMAPGSHLLVVGGGFIGLEVAAAARLRDCGVTVVEAGPGVLGRVATREIAAYVQQCHEAHGVRVLPGIRPVGFSRTGRKTQAVLSDGTMLEADCIVVGIGVEPETGLAETAGLHVDDGIVTDRYCLTSDPTIYAAGDVANQFNPLFRQRIRLETYQNAEDQGRSAGFGMAGFPTLCAEVPWAWSNQFDLNIQVAGLPALRDRVVVRGAPDSGSFCAFSIKDDRLSGAVTINRGRDMALIKRLLKGSACSEWTSLADDDVPLRQLLAA
jgi:3-phenylpropionate/trans-cinnamate dioxygenase ferredoxin reductase subunit